MSVKQDKNVLNYRKKNKKKFLRTIIQFIILATLIFYVANAVFFIKKYEAPLQANNNTNGFVALSYFGVDRSGNTKYISKQELESQLTLLKNQGFETISQEQIIEFYKNGTPLPKKALFLSFEDGRNDSSIFAQKTLEKLNYKATMFTYADKMNTRDTKFLKPKDLKPMIKSGYWELGSNGYRLKYINVFNAEGNYLGEIDENKVSDKTKIEYYNHYLMDFLRDEYLISKESRTEMEERISTDYKKLEKIYKNDFSYMPKAYAIMHANSLYNNMNPLVQKVNDQNIKKLFEVHFNQDSSSYNDKETNTYNLNRLQVAPYWPTNHLLMKINTDSNIPMIFETGDKKTASKWFVQNGVAEYKEENIILTSLPGKEVVSKLKEDVPIDANVSVTIQGNVMGQQSIQLRSPINNTYIKLILEKNILSVIEKKETANEHTVSRYELNEIVWDKDSYAFNKATTYSYIDTQQGSRIDDNEYPSNLKNNRKIALSINKHFLHVSIDKTTKFSLDISNLNLQNAYTLQLAGASITQNTQHEKFKDDIYDSIFHDLVIKKDDTTLYTTTPSKADRILKNISDNLNNTIDFFIENF